MKLAHVERTIFETDLVKLGKFINFKAPIDQFMKKKTIKVSALEKEGVPTNNLQNSAILNNLMLLLKKDPFNRHKKDD